MTEFQQFFDTMTALNQLFEELISFENRKLDSIAAADIDTLDRYMNEEQVLLLKLRGLDQKREKLMRQMGFSELTFQQMIDRFTGEDQKRLSDLYEALSLKTGELKSAIDCTKKFIELHQHGIEVLLNQLAEGSPGTYDQKGAPIQSSGESRFVPKNV